MRCENEPQGSVSLDRERLLSGFLAAVKVCQVRYGGRTELATESDPRVAALCQCLEETLTHGLRSRITSKGMAAIKQVTGMMSSGLNLYLTLGGSDSDHPVLWWYVRELLTRHEFDRFLLLKQVTTDVGRGRAWLRSLLNEHSLERYIHIMVTDQAFLELWYEPWALLRDQERAAMLPNLAAGLDSILFAINIDNGTFNSGSKESLVKPKPQEPEPLIASTNTEESGSSDNPVSPSISDHKKRKKKIPSQIVSFDDDVLSSYSVVHQTPSGYFSAPSTSLNSPALACSVSPYSDSMDRIAKEQKSHIATTAKGVFSKPIVNTNKCFTSVDKDLSAEEKRVPSLSTSPVLNAPQSRELPSYEQSLEDLLVDSCSTGIFKNLHSVKMFEKDTTSYRSGQSNNSSESLQTSDDSRGASTLTPFKGGPSTLTPMSPDGESLFDFSAADDADSLKSSSQDEFDNEDCKGDANLVYNQSSMEISSSVPGSKAFTNSPSSFSTLSHDDLRTAILEISRARDLAQENRAELNSALNREMEISSALRAQLAHEQAQHKEITDKTAYKVDAMIRENELLRHQLKKYVSAVQLLRREGVVDSSARPSTQPPDLRDYHDEALAYENKLIQVAEMHGELMEFNERLQRLLKFRESQVRHLKEELIELRGPLPNEDEDFDEIVSVTSDLETLSPPRTLINIWIPTAFLAGPSSDTHHVYQVYVSIKGDEWNVYRRFAQFYELHKKFYKKNSVVKTFDFPQKKTFGYKDISVVENRRIRLQEYLRKLVNMLVTSHPKLGTEPDKKSLIEVLPFLSDVVPKETSGKTPRKFLSRLSSNRSETSVSLQAASPSPQYNGL